MVNCIWKSINPKIENVIVIILSFVSIILSSISPDITLLGIVVFPIPIVLLYLKLDKIKFSAFTGILILASFIVNGFWGTLSCLLATVMTGITIGETLKKGKDGVVIVKRVTLTMMIAVSAIGGIFLLKSDVSLNQILSDAQQSYEQRIDNIADVYRKNNMSEDIVNQLLEYKKQFDITDIANQLPYIIAFGSLITASIIYLLTRVVLSEANVKLPKKVGFGNVYFGNLYGAALIGLFSIGIILKYSGIGIGETISVGSMSILLYSLILNAYAMIFYFLQQKFKMSKILIVVILILSSFLIGNMLMAIVGFAEMMLNFRKLDPHSLRKVKKEH